MTASNLGLASDGLSAFASSPSGPCAGSRVGALTHQPALLWTNVVLTRPRSLRHLAMARPPGAGGGGRPCGVEGERAYAWRGAVSRSPLLGRAPVLCGGEEVGHCIDAMAGCRSGKLDYLVVSEGGVAGVGERLRRLPWSEAHVEGEYRDSHFAADRFERLGGAAKGPMAGALIVTAEIAQRDFSWLDGLAPRPLSGRAQPGARAPHDVPRTSAFGRSRACVARARSHRSTEAAECERSRG